MKRYSNSILTTETPKLTQVQAGVLNDVKEMFDQSTGTESDNDINRQKRNKSSQESIIIDEEYEIFTQPPLSVVKSSVKTCPFCYQYVQKKSEQLIYNSTLNQYYVVHMACCIKYQAKDMGFKLNSIKQFVQLKCEAEFETSPKLECTLTTLDDVKVFVELKVYHPISINPLIKMNHSAVLQHKRHSSDGIVLMDVALLEMQNKLYQPKRIYIPFLEGRVSADIFILDRQLNQPEKNSFSVDFFYTIQQESGQVTLKSLDQCIVLRGLVEEKTTSEMQQETSFTIDKNLLGDSKVPILNIKSLTFNFPDLLKNRNVQSQVNCTQRSNPDDPFIFQHLFFTPQTQPITPQITNMSSSPQQELAKLICNLSSFSLNEDSGLEINQTPFNGSQCKLEDLMNFTEDITNIEQIRGNIKHLVKTQQGSRLVQKFFTICTQSDLDVIIKEIEDQIPDLMIDPYANYMFGSLSQSCVPSQRVHILKNISSRLIEIACDKKGTHAVQALVSLISSRQEEDLIERAIREDVVKLVFDNQGTHLIKKVISRFSEEKLHFFVEKILDQFLSIVNHQYGLCVMKDLMSKFKSNHEKSQLIIKKMVLHLDEIIQDPYGNYAIQHAMDIYGDTNCSCLIERVLQKVVQLSIHKYSSNVVEKCILDTSYSTKRKFVLVLAKEEVNLELMKNKFGSFVLQKALTVAKNDKQLFSTLISSLYGNLAYLYATNIRQKWQEYLDNVSPRKVSNPESYYK